MSKSRSEEAWEGRQTGEKANIGYVLKGSVSEPSEITPGPQRFLQNTC